MRGTKALHTATLSGTMRLCIWAVGRTSTPPNAFSFWTIVPLWTVGIYSATILKHTNAILTFIACPIFLSAVFIWIRVVRTYLLYTSPIWFLTTDIFRTTRQTIHSIETFPTRVIPTSPKSRAMFGQVAFFTFSGIEITMWLFRILTSTKFICHGSSQICCT
jgi:hypothetical protein